MTSTASRGARSTSSSSRTQACCEKAKKAELGEGVSRVHQASIKTMLDSVVSHASAERRQGPCFQRNSELVARSRIRATACFYMRTYYALVSRHACSTA
eukprot:6205703-Pleurochrysis_carterae.AAC.2